MVDYGAMPFLLTGREIDWVTQTLAAMSDEEKVGQLFCLLAPSCEADTLTDLVQRYRPGGILFRPQDAESIRAAIAAVQESSAVPMLVAANLENGGVDIHQDGTAFGSQMLVAASGDPQNAYRLGMVSGAEGRALGVNWTFSPVGDICLNFRNPITNVRAFGDDALQVAQLSCECIRGIQEQGMAACLKHFPGDGVDDRDQHLLPAVNTLSVEAWERTYGQVYRMAIQQGVQSIMAAHILLPAYQQALNPQLQKADMLPASLSPELLQGLLRQKLGFNGLIVSDATVMAGFTMAMKREEAVPAAIQAGCDMFLFNLGIQSDYCHMLRGLKRGLLTRERLTEAAGRVLALKASLQLTTQAPVLLSENTRKRHRQWARETARAGITLVKDTQKLLPLDTAKHRRLLVYVVGCENPLSPSMQADRACAALGALLEKRGFAVKRFTGEGWDFAASQQAPTQQLQDVDAVLYVAHTQVLSNQTAMRISFLTERGTISPKFLHERPTLCVSLCSPYHLQDMPRVKTLVNAYADHEYALEAVADALTGAIPFAGNSPVDASCGMWDTML